MTDVILTLNAGSSSLKFSLFRIGSAAWLTPVLQGEVETGGIATHFQATDQAGATLADEQWPDGKFDQWLGKTIGWVEAHIGTDRLVAVGHRVVHGGPEHDRPERVTPELLLALERLKPLAPLHEPHNLVPILAIAASRPDLPQVACFDTAFHHGMPVVATRFALPRDYEAAGIRRYGFHGLSYEYIANRLHEAAPDLARGRIIAAHLGNGASLCAMRDGRSVDTTMGFTALDGLVMGTRCGAIDPGVILYLQQQRGLSPAEIQDLLYKRSGLLGVSGGISSDMRILLASADARAREAIELFVYRIGRDIGALASSLGGLDGLVFTAGIGAHSPEIRALVCARLGWLGVVIDPEANRRSDLVISAASSRVQVRVMPTDEEAMIARHTLAAIRGADGAARLPAA
jgi:acetate kinase